jgi:cysteine desulfurase
LQESEWELAHVHAYLDYNAATPLDPRLWTLIQQACCYQFGSPDSRDHRLGWDAADAIAEARQHVAELVGADVHEIVFTSGATESLNTIVKGVRCIDPDAPLTIATWPTEHLAALAPMHQQVRATKARVEFGHVAGDCTIDLNACGDWLQSVRPTLVSLMLANNETGTINPVTEVGRFARRVSAQFVSDVSQAVGRIPVNLHELGVDFAAFSAHKMCGPKGIGALFIRQSDPPISLEPLIVGGGQERGLRAGTLNVAGIVGFGEACRIAKVEMVDEATRVGQLRDRFEQSVRAALQDVALNGDPDHRLPNTTNLCFHGVDARTMIRDMHDIACSTRSACSSGRPGPSHVLKSMGLTDDDAYSSVRFSLGRFTTEAEIDYAIDKVVSSVRRLRRIKIGALA